MQIETIPQYILDEVHKEQEERKKQLKKKGKLSKNEMILLFNILNNLYDSFDETSFGCNKQEYKNIIDRLDALTEWKETNYAIIRSYIKSKRLSTIHIIW